MNVHMWMRAALISVFPLISLSAVQAEEKDPIDVIQDNSFLVEEAYNQEPGVIQHYLDAIYTTSGRRNHGWQFAFTQEWPAYGLEHQLSYTIPWSHFLDAGQRQNGLGDVLLNYRYQALEEGPGKPAFAPRFTGGSNATRDRT